MIQLEVPNYDCNETIKALIIKAFQDNPDLSICKVSKLMGIGKSSLYRYIYHYEIKLPRKPKKLKYIRKTNA